MRGQSHMVFVHFDNTDIQMQLHERTCGCKHTKESPFKELSFCIDHI